MSDGRTITNEQLLKEVEYLQDEYARMKKMYEDLFYNLDYDNLSSNFKLDLKRFSLTFSEVFPDGSEGKSRFYMTAEQIYTEVSKTYETKTDAGIQYASLQSYVNQTAESITSAVSATYETKSDAGNQYTNLQSTITQTATEITSTVSATYETKDNVEQKISVVRQTADKISWLVADGDSASNFTLTSRVADLVATKINITGYVTFSSLSTPGESVIDGGNVKADTLQINNIVYGTSPAYPIVYCAGNSANPTITIGYAQAASGGGYYTAAAITLHATTFNVGTSSMSPSNISLYSSDTIRIDARNYTNIYAGSYGVSIYYDRNNTSSRLRLQNSYIESSDSESRIGSSSSRWVNGWFTNLNTTNLTMSGNLGTSSSRITNGYFTALYATTIGASITGSRVSNAYLNQIDVSGYFELGSNYTAGITLNANGLNIGSSTSGARIGFFGKTPVTRQTVAKLASNASQTDIINKINQLLDALNTSLNGYGILN